MSNPLQDGILRSVKLVSQNCGCGYPLNYAGVKEWQPQPGEGSYTMCPRCMRIYILVSKDDALVPENIAQREIPLHVLAQRDAILTQMAPANFAPVKKAKS